MQKIIGIILLLCAYGLLIPGLTQTMLSVSGTVEKSQLVDVGKQLLKDSDDVPAFVADLADKVLGNMNLSGTIDAFDKTNSILGTAKELYTNNHVPVAVLILLFSVGIPFLKALVLILANLPFSQLFRKRMLWISSISSKWSMADVFVVGIFVAYLAANGIQESKGLVDFDAQLGVGFYYFLGYCLISILGTQLLTRAALKNTDLYI